MSALLHTRWLPLLGSAILHSLWEGALVVLVVALALRCLRGAAPGLRYTVALSGLLLMAGMPVRHLLPHRAVPGAVLSTGADPRTEVPAGDPAAMGTASPAHPAIAARLGKGLPWVAALWLLGVCLGVVRMAGGWFWLQRLRWVKAELAPDAVQGCLLGLCRRARLKRALTVLVCDGLGGPCVVGLLRPAILVPAGWFLNLPPDLVEALLAHEMAHVLRHDYALNLLQSVLEVVLFYHPGIWWLSRRIREERELSCDAYALRLLGDPLPLAEALVTLGRRGLGQAAPRLAPAAHGGPLMARISHLLLPPRRSSGAQYLGAVTLLILLLASGLHMVARSPETRMVAVHLEGPGAASGGGGATLKDPALHIHRRNATDPGGHPVPYTQVLDIQAKGVALYQVWKVFDEVAKDQHEDVDTWFSRDEAAQGPRVDLDLKSLKPEEVQAVLHRLAVQNQVQDYQPSERSEWGDISVSKYSARDGRVLLNVHARHVGAATLDRLLGFAKSLQPGAKAILVRPARDPECPKVDALFEGLTLEELEVRLRRLKGEER